MSVKRVVAARLAAGLVVAALSCTGVALAVDGSGGTAGAWNADADCGLCHAVQADSLEGIAPQKEAAKIVVPPGRAASVKQEEPAIVEEPTEVLAAKHGSLDCALCHSDEQSLAAVHEDVTEKSKTPKALNQTEVDSQVCLTCHDSLKELAKKTEDSHALKDREGLVVNPHALPNSEEHASIACGDCHKMHTADSVSSTSTKECASCHHQGVFECGTCHEVK